MKEKKEEGLCPICEKNVYFTAKNACLRANYICSGCRSIPRERAIMQVIQTRYPNWHKFYIHESSPSSRGASVKIANRCEHLTVSQYDPELGFGNIHQLKNYRSEDLENQTFADASFDIVVTQDVLEHVFDAQAVFREICRTLKPGGVHIFTTPIVNKNSPTQQCAERTSDGSVIYHTPPKFHGNPMSDRGSLVTWNWGYDIKEFIEKASSTTVELINPFDPKMGIEAEYIDVLIQKKTSNR